MIALVPMFVLAAQAIPYELTSDSHLWIEGDSNAHRWSCHATTITSALSVDLNDRQITRDVLVRIPVRSIECGNGSMNDKLRDALKSSQDPLISYRLIAAERLPGAGIRLRATGDLTIAGRTLRVTFDIIGEQQPNGAIHARGSVPLRMSEFDVKPPTAVLGMFRAYDPVTVKFDLWAVPRAATAAPSSERG